MKAFEELVLNLLKKKKTFVKLDTVRLEKLEERAILRENKGNITIPIRDTITLELITSQFTHHSLHPSLPEFT